MVSSEKKLFKCIHVLDKLKTKLRSTYLYVIGRQKIHTNKYYALHLNKLSSKLQLITFRAECDRETSVFTNGRRTNTGCVTAHDDRENNCRGLRRRMY